MASFPTRVRLLTNQKSLGYNAGDTNLYRYVGNNPTNLTDPNGLEISGPRYNPYGTPFPPHQPMTEAGARSILEAEIARWQQNGWGLTANLLRHFLDKKGPAPYILTKEDKDEVIKESEGMVKKALIYAILDDPTITPRALATPKGVPIKFNELVRWNPVRGESMPGTLYSVVASERVQDNNNPLFYAYAQANLNIEGTVKCVLVQRGNPVLSGGRYYSYEVQAKVTISDKYTFEPEGPGGSRLWITEYLAAHHLEVTEGYKPFSHTVTFEKKYTGLRLNTPFNF